MIYYSDNVNLLTWFDEQTVPTGIVHQCNCFHTMGGGIALQIAKRYPEAVHADRQTIIGDTKKLGTFSVATVSKDPLKLLYNLYSQFTFGNGRQTSYDALVDGLTRVKINAITNNLVKLGIPHNMGAGLGGGNWDIIDAILRTLFLDERDISLVICKYEPK